MLTIFFAASAIVKLLETELSVTKHLTSLNVPLEHLNSFLNSQKQRRNSVQKTLDTQRTVNLLTLILYLYTSGDLIELQLSKSD